MIGQNAMPALSAQVSRDQEWKNLDPLEKVWMQQCMEDRKAAKVSEPKPVRIAAVVEGFSSRLDTEVCGHSAHIAHSYQLTHASQISTLASVTGAHTFYGCVRGQPSDTFSARQHTSPEVKAAWTMLFKQSFESMVYKVDAYLVAGLAGAIRLGEGNDKSDKARKEIRRLIHHGLGMCCLSSSLRSLTMCLQVRFLYGNVATPKAQYPTP